MCVSGRDREGVSLLVNVQGCACGCVIRRIVLITKIDQSKASLTNDFPQLPFLLLSVSQYEARWEGFG